MELPNNGRTVNIGDRQMTDKQLLSRLRITGKLNESTPIIVITSVADAHGIKYNQRYLERSSYVNELISVISKTEVPSIGVTSPDMDKLATLSAIARFVNSDTGCHWQKPALMEGYNHLISYCEPWTRTLEGINLVDIGEPTVATPRSISVCILYQLCIRNNIELRRLTTLDEMLQIVRQLTKRVEDLRSEVLELINNANRSTLVTIGASISTPNSFTHQELINIATRYLDTLGHEDPNKHMSLVERLLSRPNNSSPKLLPKYASTTAEAIVFAALIKKIDIIRMSEVSSSSILSIYRMLVSGKNISIMSKCPRYYDMNYSFNPNLPRILYTNEAIKELHAKECPSQLDERTGSLISNIPLSIEQMYSALQIETLTATFHDGWRPNISNKQTMIDLEEVSSIDPTDIICYGVEYQGSMIAVLPSELSDYFDSNCNMKNFLIPVGTLQNSENFSISAISKLRYIADTRATSPIRSPKQKHEDRRLVKSIDMLMIFSAGCFDRMRELKTIYETSSNEIKSSIIKALMLLHKLSFCMRGWIDETSPLPVNIAVTPIDKQPAVFMKVTDGIAKLEQHCCSMEKLGALVMLLPLIKYEKGRYIFLNNVRGTMLRIGERLEIVKRGEDIEACIRISSNWFAATSHRYLTFLGQKPLFDIDQLAIIS